MRGAILGMVLLTFAPLAWATAAPRTEAELQEWIQQGRGAEAYEALKSAEDQEGSLDYLIGLAALATGNNDEAVSRLASYVKRHPTEDPPRFELARALERSGRRDEAIEQYRFIQAKSISAPARQQAEAELARFEALPVIPVKAVDEEKEKEKPRRKVPRFSDEKPELGGNVFANAGYDSNANMTTDIDVERFFFFDVFQEQKTSDTPYAGLGTSVTYARPFNKHLSWRNAANVSARTNPSAHFDDSRNVNAQTALRWTGALQRLTGGLAYSVGWLDDREFDNEVAATALLETLTPIVRFGFSVEGARMRFPAAPLRNVNSMYVRGKVERAPYPDMVWFPTLAVYVGEENEVQTTSSFGRAVWGWSGALARRLTETLQAEATLDLGASHYRGTFTRSERREDRRYAGSLFLHWQPSAKSMWTFSAGGRYVRNLSNEPLYDASRSLVGIEIARAWGARTSDPELLIGAD